MKGLILIVQTKMNEKKKNAFTLRFIMFEIKIQKIQKNNTKNDKIQEKKK